MTRDLRDPEELYMSILATRKHFGCSILEAADRVDAEHRRSIGHVTNGRNSYAATERLGASVSTNPSDAPTAGRS